MRVTEKATLTLILAVVKGTIERLICLRKLLECKNELKISTKKAVYIHCWVQNLSLVVVSACKITFVHNVLDIVKKVSRLFAKVCFYCFNV